MPEGTPLVSVGMPVYNAAATIAHSIESIRAQDLHDWEMLISDNGSLDETWDIITHYSSLDRRITGVRSTTNRGQIWNFNRVFQATRGKFFLWHSDHDRRHPTYFSRTVSILENDPHCVLVFCSALQIDLQGNSLAQLEEFAETRGLSPLERFFFTMRHIQFANKIYGMIRRETLAQTGLFRVCVGGDAVLLLELALHGSFAHVDELLFYPGRNRAAENHFQYKARVMSALDTAKGEHSAAMSWRQLFRIERNEILDVLRRSSLSRADSWHAMRTTVTDFDRFFGA